MVLASPPDVLGRQVVQRLVAVRDLRGFRPGDPGNDGDRELRLRAASASARARPDGPVRVRRLAGAAAAAALHGQLLPDGDALHSLRHRDRLSLSARGDPPPAELVRVLRVPGVPGDPARRLRLHLAERSARMALDKPLKDLGMKSERLLWPKSSKFEDEVSDLE